jgi:Predicted transcriptional regulator
MPKKRKPGVIHCRLDELLEERGMTLAELAKRIDITYANLSVLKNDHGRAVRFTTLAAICAVLECDVGDVFEVRYVR